MIQPITPPRTPYHYGFNAYINGLDYEEVHRLPGTPEAIADWQDGWKAAERQSGDRRETEK